MQNSVALTIPVTCPQCGDEFKADVWIIIDISEHPELLRIIDAGTLHNVHCPNCSHEILGDGPLLLYRPNDYPHVVYSPSEEKTEEVDWKLSIKMYNMLRKSLGEIWQDEWWEQAQSISRQELAAYLRQRTGHAAPDIQKTTEGKSGRLVLPPDLLDELLEMMNADEEAADGPELSSKQIGALEATLEYIQAEKYTEVQAKIFSILGIAYRTLSTGDRAENLSQAIAYCHQALRLRNPDVAPLDYAKTYVELGMAYGELPTGNLADNQRNAITCFQKALSYLTLEDDPLDYANASCNLGIAYGHLTTGDRAENLNAAIDCFRVALRHYTPENDPLHYALTHNSLGTVYAQLPTGNRANNLRQANECFQESLRYYTPETAPSEYAAIQNNLGLIYPQLSGNQSANLRQAIGSFRQALRICTPETAPLACFHYAGNLADLFAKNERWYEAFEVYQLGLQAAERLFGYVYQPDSQQAQIAETHILYALMVRTCLHLKDDPAACREGLVTVEKSKARLFLDQMGLAEYPPPPDVPEGILANEEQLLQQLRELERLLSLPHPSTDEKRAFAKQRKAVKENLDVLWGQMARKYPQSQEYLALRKGQAPTWENLHQLSRKLGPETALVEFFALDEEIGAFILRDGWEAPQVFSLPIHQQRIFHRYIESYNREIFSGGPDPLNNHEWLNFGEELLTPLMGALEGTQLVYFIPHRWMHLLPLHALTVNGKPFIEQKAVAYAPSAAILARILERRADRGELAAPLVAGYTPSNDKTERDIFLGEAQDIATYFGAIPLLDGEVTWQRLQRYMEKAGLIHLSCHGYYNEQDSLASSVLLADGEVTAREWMVQRIRAELITLSACQTGYNKVSEGDDISGLSRALLYAGAKSVLLSLWSVEAQSTREWMEDFYQSAWSREGLPLISKAQAFQKAVLALREQYPDPYFWAPFILTGDAI